MSQDTSRDLSSLLAMMGEGHVPRHKQGSLLPPCHDVTSSGAHLHACLHVRMCVCVVEEAKRDPRLLRGDMLVLKRRRDEEEDEGDGEGEGPRARPGGASGMAHGMPIAVHQSDKSIPA
jgi:hypothetical protein